MLSDPELNDSSIYFPKILVYLIYLSGVNKGVTDVSFNGCHLQNHFCEEIGLCTYETFLLLQYFKDIKSGRPIHNKIKFYKTAGQSALKLQTRQYNYILKKE